MANLKISDLPAIDAPASADVFPMDDASAGSNTKKVSLTQLIAALPTIPPASSSVAGTMSTSDKVKLDASTSAATASTLVFRDGSGDTTVHAITAVNGTITGALTAAQITLANPPTASTDAANKAYVDAAAQGLTIKAAVLVSTIGGNVTLSGGTPGSMDSVALNIGDRILVKDQTDAKQNGIYTVSVVGTGANGTWVRATDADTGPELPTGSYVFVNSGTIHGSSSWVMNTPGTITIGTSLIVWVLFSQIGSVPATSITGLIVGSQVADGFLTTAKFAASIAPVELVSTLPVAGNFQGRTVYLKTVDGSFAADKIYRWTSPSVTTGTAFWTSVVPAVDITGNLTDSQIANLSAAKLTGQITQTQITDGSISTPKLAAGSVTTANLTANCVTSTNLSSSSVTSGKVAAGVITSNELSANSVISGKVAAGAISTTELAAGAIVASKIASGTITTTQIASNTILAGNIATGTITADRLNVTSLSSISANIGTITAGSLTSSASVSVGSGLGAVSISSSGFNIGSGRISMAGDGSNPWVRVYGAGGYSGQFAEINGQNGALPPYIAVADGGGNITMSSGGLVLAGNKQLFVTSGCTIQGPGNINLNPDSSSCMNIGVRESGSGGVFSGWLVFKVNGRNVFIQFET